MQYPVKATVATPNPGNRPLKRFHRLKGPVYLQISLYGPVSDGPIVKFIH